MNDRARQWTEVAAVAGFCTFFFFFALSNFGLVGADEPRYAQVAREMLERHDWITPTLNGQAWLEKPVLYYWNAMLSYKLFGVSDWAARLPSAAWASLLIAIIYWCMRRLHPGTQLDAGLTTASAAAMIGFGRGASPDILLASSFGIAMLAWWLSDEGRGRTYLALAYAFLAVAALAKGPVAPALAVLVLLSYALVLRDAKVLTRTGWLPGIILFCLIALPWYAAVQGRNPQFFREFILEHNLARFATNLYRHRQPFWYYLPVLLLALMPWTVFAARAVYSSIARCFFLVGGKQLSAASEGEARFTLFLILWGIVPVVFFSISESKLPGYILPAAPAYTILLANDLGVRQERGERTNAWLATLHAALSGLLVGAVLLSPHYIVHTKAPRQAWMIAGMAAAVVFVAMLASLLRQGTRVLRFVTLAPMVVAMAYMLRVAAPALDLAQSARPVAREIRAMELRPSRVAVFKTPRQTEYGLNFYRNQMIQRYERGEIPATDHFVIAPAGSQQEITRLVDGRRVSKVGGLGPQGLEYFFISEASVHTPKSGSRNH